VCGAGGAGTVGATDVEDSGTGSKDDFGASGDVGAEEDAGTPNDTEGPCPGAVADAGAEVDPIA
jgi:hypothetical protein